MSYPETTTMATASAFNLPTMAGLDFGNDDLADDMEGLTLSFPKVKIPSGGALQFELPTGDPENPEYTRFLQIDTYFAKYLPQLFYSLGPRAVNTMITPSLCAPLWTESRATVHPAAPVLPVS